MRYSREDSRWPYTYAYDWMRMAGMFEARADGPEWFRDKAKALSIDVRKLQEKAADEYIAYYNAIEQVEDDRNDKVAWWSGLESYAKE
jgi:hypothetical protein